MEWTKQRKMMISCGLTLLSAVLALLGRTRSCTLAALAMGACTLADALLAGFPGCFADIKNRLIKGGAVFFAAHLLYIRALCIASGEDCRALLPAFWFPFAVFLALTILHARLFFFRTASPVSRSFFAAGFLYLSTVGAHAALAAALCAKSGGRYALNAAGALLFYLSDAVLLARKYGAVRGRRVTDMIWLTYIPSQLCLMAGFYLSR